MDKFIPLSQLVKIYMKLQTPFTKTDLWKLGKF